MTVAVVPISRIGVGRCLGTGSLTNLLLGLRQV